MLMIFEHHYQMNNYDYFVDEVEIDDDDILDLVDDVLFVRFFPEFFVEHVIKQK